MKKLQIQQGDVLIESAEIPEGAKQLTHGKLAEGEATGHQHSIANLGMAMLLEHNKELFLNVTAPQVEINHQEHLSVTVPMGTYRIGIVREYDPFEQETRRVRD